MKTDYKVSMKVLIEFPGVIFGFVGEKQGKIYCLMKLLSLSKPCYLSTRITITEKSFILLKLHDKRYH